MIDDSFNSYGVGVPLKIPKGKGIETIFLYIPERTVGAVIGTKGQNIKNIMHNSSAKIKIMNSDRDGSTAESNEPKKANIPALGPISVNDVRKVVISGTPEAQWKAQFYLFERVKAELRERLGEHWDLQLRTEMLVPKASIGRIIGKK